MTVQEEVLRCLDNTAPIENYQDLGLFYFAKRFFPNTFDLPFGRLHYMLANLTFRMYDPDLKSRMERQMYALVHRGAAKTTLESYLFPLYIIYLKQAFMKRYPCRARIYDKDWKTSRIVDLSMSEDFILIISETASSAENFVSNIKSTIDDRTDLIPIFGDKHADALVLDDEYSRGRGELIWRKNAFITSDRTIVYGIGSGQQIRGKNVLNRRPTLAIIDDMYSERNTKTEEARAKIDTWFYSAMKNSVDIRKGKAIVLGTMVHPDTIFKDFNEHNDLWQGLRLPIIAEEELHEVIKKHCHKKGMYLHIPTKDKCAEIEKSCTSLSWKEQYSLHAILSLYKELYEKGKEDYFYREYMNVIRKDAERSLDESAFKEVEMDISWNGWQHILEVKEETGRVWRGVCELYGGVDIASSASKSSDDTAMVYGGVAKLSSPIPGTDQSQYRTYPFIYEIIGGKFATFDIPAEDTTDGNIRHGWVNMVEKLCTGRTPMQMVVVEVAGQYEPVFNEAYAYFSRKNIGVTLFAVKPPNDMKKEERIMNILLPLKQRYRQILLNKQASRKDIFYSQLRYLGSDGMHDDYPDATAYMFQYAREPMQEVLSNKPKTFSERRRTAVTHDWETM